MKKVTDLFNPNDEDIKKLFPSPAFYPHEQLDPKTIQKLLEIGLQSNVSEQHIISRAEKLDDAQDFTFASYLVSYLEKRVHTISYWDKLRSLSWLPCMERPENIAEALWPTSRLCRPEEAATKSCLLWPHKPVAMNNLSKLFKKRPQQIR